MKKNRLTRSEEKEFLIELGIRNEERKKKIDKKFKELKDLLEKELESLSLSLYKKDINDKELKDLLKKESKSLDKNDT
jgi:hypothetical protein